MAGGNGDIEDIIPSWTKVHKEALDNSKRTYTDPDTGYMVFTELSHKDRGYCCGNACRHCPYEHENVGNPEKLRQQAREARQKRQKAKNTPDK